METGYRPLVSSFCSNWSCSKVGLWAYWSSYVWVGYSETGSIILSSRFWALLSISLNRRLVEDRLVWHFHRQGTFTNSAYFVANGIALGNVLAPHPPIDIYGRLWKAIWNAKVPGKVAINIWRSCARILLIRENLVLKGYDGEMSCLLCPHGLKNSMHWLVECPYAKATWQDASLLFDIVKHDNRKDCVLHLSSSWARMFFPEFWWSSGLFRRIETANSGRIQGSDLQMLVCSL